MARVASKSLPLIGWKELVHLPSLHFGPIIAKIDTGARSAALHADDILVRGKRVKFSVPIRGRKHWHDVPLLGQRQVKSSSGHVETRAVIETVIVIGKHSFRTEVTLTDRTDMGVPMLLGRSSLGGRFVVNPAKSFVLGKATKRQT
jgi:hypothetical protein